MAKKKPTLSTINRKLDNLARDICKVSADYTCQRCGEKGDSSSIEWAHIEPRKYKSIRWDSNNSLALCNAKINNCHRWFDRYRALPMEWLSTFFPEKHEWLLEIEAEGLPNASTITLEDRIQLAEELKEIRDNLV